MKLNNRVGINEAGDGFPWDTVSKRSVYWSEANKVAGIKVSTHMSNTEVVVCRKLKVTMAGVSEAIVFDEVHVTMGNIKDLHCLSTTTRHVGWGSIDSVHIHSQEELVKMALEKLGMSPQPSPSAPVEPIYAHAVVEEDIKHSHSILENKLRVMKLNNSVGINEAGDGFPWDTVGERSSVEWSGANKVAGIKVSTHMSYAEVVVCRKLKVTMAGVSEAIVFDEVHVTMGNIKDLHCLSTTTQHAGLGRIDRVHIHSREDLVKMALEKLGMSPQPSPSAPVEPIYAHAEVEEDIKH